MKSSIRRKKWERLMEEFIKAEELNQAYYLETHDNNISHLYDIAKISARIIREATRDSHAHLSELYPTPFLLRSILVLQYIIQRKLYTAIKYSIQNIKGSSEVTEQQANAYFGTPERAKTRYEGEQAFSLSFPYPSQQHELKFLQQQLSAAESASIALLHYRSELLLLEDIAGSMHLETKIKGFKRFLGKWSERLIFLDWC